VQNSLLLAGVQVPPTPLLLMVIQPASHPAFQARPTLQLLVLQIYGHLALAQLQFHSFHGPGCFNSQNLSVQFTILHPPIVASGVRDPLQTLNSRKWKAGFSRLQAMPLPRLLPVETWLESLQCRTSPPGLRRREP
jgi:hypothetical protein